MLDAADGEQLDSGRLLAFTGEADIRGYAGKLLVIGQADGAGALIPIDLASGGNLWRRDLGEPDNVGAVNAIPSTCSWNHACIVCATDEQFQIHRFRDV